MEIDEHIDAIVTRGGLLTAAAAAAGLDAPVPTCPDWRVRDLVAHQGGVHRWATWHVTNSSATSASDDETARLFTTPDDAGLLDWFVEGHTALVAVLRSADPALECWSFLPAPSPLAFWARRQAHETTMHSLDAEAAAGRATEVPAALAADGIDELVMAFLARRRGRLVADPPRSLAIAVAGSDAAWTIRIEADQRVCERGRSAADCTITGTADGLYRFVWNRAGRDAITAHGDEAVLDLWRTKALVTWG